MPTTLPFLSGLLLPSSIMSSTLLIFPLAQHINIYFFSEILFYILVHKLWIGNHRTSCVCFCGQKWQKLWVSLWFFGGTICIKTFGDGFSFVGSLEQCGCLLYSIPLQRDNIDNKRVIGCMSIDRLRINIQDKSSKQIDPDRKIDGKQNLRIKLIFKAYIIKEFKLRNVRYFLNRSSTTSSSQKTVYFTLRQHSLCKDAKLVY